MLEVIKTELKISMKEKDTVKTTALRSLLANISALSKEKNAKPIDNNVIIKQLKKEIKQRKQSATIYKENGRDDLYNKELVEVEVLEEFLPKQLNEEQIKDEVEQAISSLNATSMKDMGKVMGFLTKKLAGKADNTLISKLVKEKIS